MNLLGATYPTPSNALYGMKAGNIYHIIMLLFLIGIIVGIFFATRKSNKARKITLIVLWAFLIVDMLVYGIANSSESKFTVLIQYTPVSWLQTCIFQYMSFVSAIILGRAVFSSKDRYAKLLAVYIIMTFGLICLVYPGQSTFADYTAGKRPWGGNGGLMMGLLYDEVFWYYIIKNAIYVAIPVLMMLYGEFHPSFRDLPIATLSLVGAWCLAYVYNNFLNSCHANLDLFYSANGKLPFHSNVLYTHSPDGVGVLKFFYKLAGAHKFFYLLLMLPIYVVIFALYSLPYYRTADYKATKENLLSYLRDVKSYWHTVFTRPLYDNQLTE